MIQLDQKGSGDTEGVVVLGAAGLIIAGILWLGGFNFGRVNEGFTKYDDCREIITLEDGNWQTYFHKFTCTSRKTKSGALMDSECVSVVNDSSLFSSSHTCAKAYVYEKKNTACQNNVKDGISYPYLGYDDMCYTTSQ